MEKRKFGRDEIEAAAILKERTDVFGGAVLEKMVELGRALKAGGKYRLKKKR